RLVALVARRSTSPVRFGTVEERDRATPLLHRRADDGGGGRPRSGLTEGAQGGCNPAGRGGARQATDGGHQCSSSPSPSTSRRTRGSDSRRFILSATSKLSSWTNFSA